MNDIIIKNIISEIIFGKKICESLEDHSVVNYLYDNLLCEKLLYGEPVTIEELRNILRKKIVNFEFIKLDGEIRPARGTLKMKYIPQVQHPKGIRPSSKKVATFYDLQKKDWRSVSQRSKEIVLKKDEDTGKPVIMVKDKPEGEEIIPTTSKFKSERTDINIGDVFNFSKISKVKYKSGDSRQYEIPTFITITRKDDEGFWGKTAGSEKEILLNDERLKRLGEPLQVGDEYQFAKLDKSSKKVFTTIKLTRKTPDGFWGKTEGSEREILLTNERLKRLHRYEQPEITINGEPVTAPIDADDELNGVKPIFKSNDVKTYHFINPKTGASMELDMTPKDTIKKLKQLGPDWRLSTEKEFNSAKENIERAVKKSKKSLEKPAKQKTNTSDENITNREEDLDNLEADKI